MKWFKHYSNARFDPKIRRLISKFRLKGYGLYFAIVETISFQLESNKPIPDLEENAKDIATFFNEDTIEIEEIIKYCLNEKLFEFNSATKRVLCLKLLSHLDNTLSNNPEIKKILNNFNNLLETSSNLKELEETSNDLKQIRLDKTRLDKNKFNKGKSENKSIKLSQFYNKTTAHLLRIYTKIHASLSDKKYNLKTETKLRYLEIFFENNKKYSWRVQAYALKLITATDEFKTHKGFVKETYQTYLKKAFKKIKNELYSTPPKCYEPEQDTFIPMNDFTMPSNYFDEITDRKLMIGDKIKKEKK